MFDKKFRYQLIGVRHGEKKHEVLLSASEFQKAEKNEDYFCVPLDDRDLNYKSYTEEGSISASNSSIELSSASARQLSVVEIKELLMLVPQIKQLVVR
jgi:UDP-glucose 4-epimerase